MCPDRELLSAWLDGEVPSPWREKIAEHIGACAECAGAVDRYRRMQSVLLAGLERDGELEGSAGERVLSRLAFRRTKPRSFWSRSLLLPLPAAAAAGVAAALLALALALSGARNAELRMAVQNSARGGVNVASGMEGILEYLSRQDAGVNITITLPAGTAVNSSGDPFMIREADYRPGGSGK